jgi:glycosyltransferase involved in cell wall biosynthesis
MSTLALVVITYNEQHNIKRCLNSVPFANEIVVLDSGSTDRTVELAKQFTTKVYVTDWPGFGPQKNRALEKVSSQWVLTLDADEYLSSKAQNNIQHLLQYPPHYAGYELPFISSYCGQTIHWGDWRHDYDIVLFKKDQAYYSNDAVHERLIMDGKSTRLNAPVMHESFQSFDEVIRKINHYSSLTAQQKVHNGKRGGLGKALTHGLWKFFRGYVLRAGFLDGKAGLMLALSNAEGTYYQYLKIAELNRHNQS